MNFAIRHSGKAFQQGSGRGPKARFMSGVFTEFVSIIRHQQCDLHLENITINETLDRQLVIVAGRE